MSQLQNASAQDSKAATVQNLSPSHYLMTVIFFFKKEKSLLLRNTTN